MTLSGLLDRYSNLFVKPFMIMTVSVIAAILTIAPFVIQFKTVPSLSIFKNLWFCRLWSLLGPISTKKDAIHVHPLVQQARGVVLDVGYANHQTITIRCHSNFSQKIYSPGSGLVVNCFDKSKIEKIYGIEPCLDLHHQLHRNIRAAGLSDIYTVVGCGAEDTDKLREYGITPESVNTIVTIKVLCSVPTPEKTIESLYKLLVPGGQWLVFEHTQNRHSWLTRVFQGTTYRNPKR